MFVRVLIDSPLPHLDRPFDYLVPEALGYITVGTRVRVPFAGRLTSAVVTEVVDGVSAHATRKVKSAATVPSIDPAGLELAHQIARRYGANTWDMVRLTIPARAASVDRLAWDQWQRTDPTPTWSDQPDPHLVHPEPQLPTKPGQRAVWDAGTAATTVGPHHSASAMPAEQILRAALAAIAEDGSAIIVVPDARAVALLLEVAKRWGLTRWSARHGGAIAVLDASDGPQVRYGSYLAALRGLAPLVIGTRHAAWQPVPHLRHLTVWDEASDLLQEPRAPYPHARTVAAMRAQSSGCALLIAGHMLSADAISLVENGFAQHLQWREERRLLPQVDVVGTQRRTAHGGAGRHWMPPTVWAPLREAARTGTAAVVVPQAGYAQGLACVRCDVWAECAQCGGDLNMSSATAVPACRDCGTEAPHWHCPECRGYRLRPVGLGVSRLATQLARMAPDVNVVESSAQAGVLADGAVMGGIVVATAGAVPAVAGGYGAMAIVGARININEGLGAEVLAARRWVNAASLVRGREQGGYVAVVGDLPDPVRAALASWDGWSLGRSDLDQRMALALPPHRRCLRVLGPADALDAVAALATSQGATVQAGADEAWVFTSRARMQRLVDALRALVVERSARGLAPLYVRVDALPGTR